MQATAEANNLTAVASAKDQYYKNMEKVGVRLGVGSLHLVSIKKQKKHTFWFTVCNQSVTMLNVTLCKNNFKNNFALCDTSVLKQH